MLKKNQELLLQIQEVTNLGFGFARSDDGQVVFVSDAAEGDFVRAKIIRVAKDYAIARTEEVLTASPHRKAAPCPIRACGGCAYRLLTREYETFLKEKHVTDCLRSEGLGDLPVDPLVVGERLTAYRNKAQYPVGTHADGKLFFGFFAPKSHRVIEATSCALQPPIFAEILNTIASLSADYGISGYREETHTGLLRHVYFRRSEAGDVHLILVVNGDSLPFEEEICKQLSSKHREIVGIVLNIQKERTNVICGPTYRLLWGKPALIDKLAGVTLSISPASFYQVNHEMATKLYEEAKRRAALQGGELLLDLYCGVGSIGLSMADAVGEVIGVEVVEEAVRAATENAAQNGITNARFYAGDAGNAEQLLERAERERGGAIRPDVVILDPPRKGCDEKLLHYLSRLAPSRIVYISCNPKTLARDLRILRDDGYLPDRVTPFDLFPSTAHVESVVCLTRK